MVSRGPTAGAAATPFAKVFIQCQGYVSNIYAISNQTTEYQVGFYALRWFLHAQTSAWHVTIRRQGMKMDALKNKMRWPNHQVQCINVRKISILNDGKRLIVVFVSELALRSPSLPGIDSSAKRDFVLVFVALFSRDQHRIWKQDLRRSPCQKHGGGLHALKTPREASFLSKRCTISIQVATPLALSR